MRFRTILPSIVLVACAALAPAQDIEQMLKGAGKPLTLNPDGLGMNFKAVQLKSTVAGGNGFLDMLMNPLMMMMGALGGMGGGSNDGPPTAILTAIDLNWTTGEMEQFFGQTYLVVYKLDFDISKMASAPPKDLSSLNLRLQFVRTDTIASITPRPDITPAEFMKMLRTPLPKNAEPPKPDVQPADAPPQKK